MAKWFKLMGFVKWHWRKKLTEKVQVESQLRWQIQLYNQRPGINLVRNMAEWKFFVKFLPAKNICNITGVFFLSCTVESETTCQDNTFQVIVRFAVTPCNDNLKLSWAGSEKNRWFQLNVSCYKRSLVSDYICCFLPAMYLFVKQTVQRHVFQSECKRLFFNKYFG